MIHPIWKLLAYRIYSNKRRIWDKKVNKRRTPDAALIRGIPYNQEKHYKTILKLHRQFIFLKCDVTSKLTERCKLFHNDKGVRSHR